MLGKKKVVRGKGGREVSESTKKGKRKGMPI